MASIFELVTSEDIVAYWESKDDQVQNLLGEELWPSQQKLGLSLKWIKGSQGLPIVLKPSAYDVVALKRNRIGFDKVSADMPFFKESMYIDEELRQQLNMVLETGNQAYIDAVMVRVFNDDIALLNGAKAQRERMRMQLLTTGAISISANGQSYDYDYGFEEWQKVEVKKAWSDKTATIVDDIREWQDEVEERTGTRPTRATCSNKTFGYITKNDEIRQAIWGADTTAPVSRTKVLQYLNTELGLDVAVYTKKFIDEAGATKQYIPDDTFVIFPTGNLGTGWFGTTPEQSDLMTGSSANVTITDVGVAVTTVQCTDPVNIDTKVTMIYLPSFEQCDKIVIADINPQSGEE
jgi:hypothetical protein